MNLAAYVENDPYAAQWLRNLIAAGHIAPGVVIEEDIRDVAPAWLRPFAQVHLYAGIGVWSHALRRAGWPDDRPVWTLSEPCQPFSEAGRRGGVSDERYLRPYTHHLIRLCRPPVVFGEQVASKSALGWLDIISADMEGEGYAFCAQDRCSAGVAVGWEESQAGEWLRRAVRDCPDPWIVDKLRDFAAWAGEGNLGEGGEHIRQRLYFVGVEHDAGNGRFERRPESGERGDIRRRGVVGVADAAQQQQQQHGNGEPGARWGD